MFTYTIRFFRIFWIIPCPGTNLNYSRSYFVINYYSCCTFPQPWALVQGTMYITQKYICFRGWPDTACKLKISMTDVHRIERENTAVVIPNAIRVYLSSGEEILFSSFIDRDPCYSLLDSSIQAEKHYAKIVAEENVSSSSLHPARLRYVDSAGSAEPSVLRDVASAEDLADLGARAGAGADAGAGAGAAIKPVAFISRSLP